MKGPGLRIGHDVRRLWVCPDCARMLRLGGDVAQVRCECAAEKSPWMQLIEAAPVFPRKETAGEADQSSE